MSDYCKNQYIIPLPVLQRTIHLFCPANRSVGLTYAAAYLKLFLNSLPGTEKKGGERMIPYLVSAALGYLLGCSNMAFYLSRLRDVDIRSAGSGNLGASNAMILMGWGAGVLTAVHDIGKGALAIVLARLLFPDAAFVGLAAGAAAVLGHNFPVFLRFRGGKGFATYFGMTLVISWKFAVIMAVAIVLLTVITDYIVTATMATVVSFPVFVGWVFGPVALAIVCAASLAVIVRHRENFVRLANGTEIGLRRAGSGKMRIR